MSDTLGRVTSSSPLQACTPVEREKRKKIKKMDNRKREKEKKEINARQRRREHTERGKLSTKKRAASVHAKQEMEVTA